MVLGAVVAVAAAMVVANNATIPGLATTGFVLGLAAGLAEGLDPDPLDAPLCLKGHFSLKHFPCAK